MMLIPWVPLAWSLIQVTAIASLALLIALAFRGRVPQVVAAILSGVCVASLLLILIAWIPSSQWSLIPFASIASNEESQSAIDSSTEKPPSDGKRPHTATDAHTETDIPDDEGIVPFEPIPQANHASPPNTSRSTHIPSLLRQWFAQKIQAMENQMRSLEIHKPISSSVWHAPVSTLLLTGILLTGLLWLYGFAYVKWLLVRSQLVSDPEIETIVCRYAQQLELKRSPEIRVSEHIPIGATVGFRRCILLLHPSWKSWSNSELNAVLVHELAHAARWDFLWVIVSGMIRVLFFFHPIIHLLVRRLRLEQELAADQLAAGLIGNARAYGRALASLTLRSQHPLRTPSPMLAAGHICIVRRISMLKQGSLRANRRLWRWAGSISVATVLVVMPLSGLRGMMQEKQKGSEVAAEQAEQPDPSVDAEKAKRIAEVAERKAANEKYPPLLFEGPMVVRPGKIKEVTKFGNLTWISEYASVAMLGQTLPDGAELHGKGFHKTEWTDLERNHGMVSEGFSVKAGEQVVPGILSKLFKSPLFQNKEVGSKTAIGDRLASGLGRIIYDPEAGSLKDPVQADTWLLDDAKGFFHGSRDEVEAYVQDQYDPYSTVPAKYLSDYRSAAIAQVFPDCKMWKKKLIDFASGSPKVATFAMFVPLYDGLEDFGYFFHADREQNFILRAHYSDEEKAIAGKSVIEGLVALGKTALASPDASEPELEYYRAILESLQVEQSDCEVRCIVNVIPTSAMVEAIFPKIFHVAESWESVGTARIEPSTDFEYATLRGESLLSLAPHVAQSIRADNYRGKQVRLQAEVACSKEARSDAGLFLQTSDAQHATLTHYSRSIDGTSDFLTAMRWDAHVKNREVDGSDWIPVSIELNVPAESHALTFGTYFYDTDLKIRNLKLMVVGNASPTSPQSPYVSSRNLFVIPGMTLQSAPLNMDFKIQNAATSEAVTKTAEVEDGKAKVVR